MKKLIFYILQFLIIIVLLSSCVSAKPYSSERFAIFISTLDGSSFKKLLTDSYREMNHVRVSPDGKWITFTRFTKKKLSGLAEEKGGNYEGTEILIMSLNGSKIETIVPARKGRVAANSYWTPDGKGLLYISTDGKKKRPRIKIIDIKTRKERELPVPEYLIPTDPHQVDDMIVFPAVPVKGPKVSSIWIMKMDGTGLRRITNPRLKIDQRLFSSHAPAGDTDPKLSPDKSKVALMRHVGKHNWHIVVVDLKTGEERDLSPPYSVDAMPEWSSDGKLLVFWHVDPKNLKKSGIYYMKPDGSERRKVPLPPGYLYKMPAFFPTDRAGPKARIVFSGKKVKGL